jgi:hypothetical protein
MACGGGENGTGLLAGIDSIPLSWLDGYAMLDMARRLSRRCGDMGQVTASGGQIKPKDELLGLARTVG